MFVLVGGEDAVIDIGTHATGVGAEVSVEVGFVILGGFEGADVYSVGDGDERDFFAGEEFFDDELGAGVADEGAVEELGCCGERIRFGGDDEDAFPGGEAIRFEDEGSVEGVDGGFGFGQGGCCGEAGGGDIMAGEEVFGEDFRAFELGCGGGGAEDVESCGAEGVDDSGDEGDFGSDNGEIDFVLAGDGEVVGGCGAGEGDALGDCGDAGISWCGEDAGDDGALG